MTMQSEAITRSEGTAVRSITPCLVFNDCAEEALNFYASVFKGTKILSILRSDTDGPIAKGKVLHAEFELDGRVYTAFDGGPSFSFSEAVSLVATCDTQEELDEVWTRLSAGGQEGPCGWLKDRFGLSWQVLPTALGRMMSDAQSGDPHKVMQALLKMGKLDIKTLEQAYRST